MKIHLTLEVISETSNLCLDLGKAGGSLYYFLQYLTRPEFGAMLEIDLTSLISPGAPFGILVTLFLYQHLLFNGLYTLTHRLYGPELRVLPAMKKIKRNILDRSMSGQIGVFMMENRMYEEKQMNRNDRGYIRS